MNTARVPTAAERYEAWMRDDPDELRRAAAEWRKLGHEDYAAYLEARARGEKPPFMYPPY